MSALHQQEEQFVDTYGRRIDYLRISVTDRCNFRCIYCMPADGVEQKAHKDILSLEEITEFAHVAARHGIKRIRVTGGEPLVRLGVPAFIKGLNAIEGIEEISITTNATLLPTYADELRDAGLTRVNISLDTLDADEFRAITRGGELADTLKGIDIALEKGFEPVKINVVVMKSFNQDLFEFAKMTIDRPLHVRFIEYMPVGSSAGNDGQGWKQDEVIASTEIIDMISSKGIDADFGSLIALRKDAAPIGAGPAQYFKFPHAQGTIGVISPLSNHFCGQCNRLRLTADGMLRPCLFSDNEYDARTAIRAHDESMIDAVINQAIHDKPKGNTFASTERLMAHIGG
jgi:cyclic pyranopterin phosphate synthase